MRKLIAFAIAITALFILAAARSDAAKTTDASKPAIITIGDDMKFSPARIVVQRGQMVAWQNSSHVIHNIVDVPEQSPKPGVMTLPKGAQPFDSGLINFGQTYVQTFTVPGTYKYACTLHIANGMLGQIIVK